MDLSAFALPISYRLKNTLLLLVLSPFLNSFGSSALLVRFFNRDWAQLVILGLNVHAYRWSISYWCAIFYCFSLNCCAFEMRKSSNFMSLFLVGASG